MFLLNVTEYIVTEIAGLHGLATLHIGKSKTWEKTTKAAFCKYSGKKCFVKLSKIHRKVIKNLITRLEV